MSLPETLNQFTAALNLQCSAEELLALQKKIVVKNFQQPLAGLDIYRRSISHSHVDTLLSIFPVCAEIVGEKLFAQWSKKYCWGATSAHQDLNCYGDSFPKFLSQQLKSTSFADDFGYLPDLAKLEYHWNQALFLADDSSFDFELFKQNSASAKNIVFQVSHSLYLMQSIYPIFGIYEAHKNQTPCASIAAIKKPEMICIYRPEFIPIGAIIPQLQYDLIQACQRELTLADIEADKNLAAGLVQLPELIAQKKITGFKLSENCKQQHHVQ